MIEPMTTNRPHRLAQPGARQALAYLLVGVWNTLFGYGMYALWLFVLTGRVPYPYMLASVLSYVINVTVAFFGYKRFVFRAQGSVWRQYVRCHCVYGSTFAVNFLLLPLVVAGLNWLLGPAPLVPYLAGGLLTLVTVAASFLGHKHFSFALEKPSNSEPTGSAPVAGPAGLIGTD